MTHCIYPHTSLSEYRGFKKTNVFCKKENCKKLGQPRRGFAPPSIYNPPNCTYWRQRPPHMTEQEEEEYKKLMRRKRFRQALTELCPKCGGNMKAVGLSRKEKVKKRMVTKQICVGYLCFHCETFKPSKHFYKEKEIYGM